MVLSLRGVLLGLARAVFAVSLPVFLLAGALRTVIYLQPLYEYSLQHYQASRTTGVPLHELERATRELIAYLGGSRESADILVTVDGRERSLFNEREIAHLRDVRNLMRLDKPVLLGTIAVQLAVGAVIGVVEAERALRSLARASMYGAALTLGLVGSVGLLAIIDWDALSLRLHLLSFSNDLWQLDPARHNLIRMFPPEFFFRAALLVAGLTMGGALLVMAVSRWYLGRLVAEASD